MTIAIIVSSGDILRPVIRLVISRLKPTADSTKFKKNAPTKISMIIAVERIVPSNARRSTYKFKRPLAAASPNVATTPSDAASVGVAHPA